MHVAVKIMGGKEYEELQMSTVPNVGDAIEFSMVEGTYFVRRRKFFFSYEENNTTDVKLYVTKA